MKLNGFRTGISLALVLISAGCVDRIALPRQTSEPRVVIAGHISADPGPYMVKVSESLDILNPYEIAKPLTVRQMLLIDDLGNIDTLTAPVNGTAGQYYTREDGVRGIPGRAYKIRFETRDGRIYESVYDTLPVSAGRIDSVYTSFERRDKVFDEDTRYNFEDQDFTYGFNIQFNASGLNSRNWHMWNFIGTYQVRTDPTRHRIPCLGGGPDCPKDSGNCGCLSPLECSGAYSGGLSECECCVCWVTVNNTAPVLPDLRLTGLNHISAAFMPLTPYTFMFKVHARVDQLAISGQTYSFFKAILQQQQAKGSLFQPMTGQIRGNIVQVSGNPVQAEGIFYSTLATSKAIFIYPEEIPDPKFIPEIDPRWYPYKKIWNSCLDFPKSTTTKPSFWID